MWPFDDYLFLFCKVFRLITLLSWDWDFSLKSSFLFYWKHRLFTSFKASMCTFLLPCVIVCSHTLMHVSANAHQLSCFQVHALLEDINCSKLTNKSFAHREVLINGGLSLNLSSSLCLIAFRITHPFVSCKALVSLFTYFCSSLHRSDATRSMANAGMPLWATFWLALSAQILSITPTFTVVVHK